MEQEPARVPLTCAPSLLRCTSTAEDSWISLPSYTPQPASTTATLFPMVRTRAGGFPGEPQIAVHLCSLPGVFYSTIPPPGAGGAGRVGLNCLLARRFYFQCHRQGMQILFVSSTDCSLADLLPSTLSPKHPQLTWPVQQSSCVFTSQLSFSILFQTKVPKSLHIRWYQREPAQSKYSSQGVPLCAPLFFNPYTGYAASVF